MEIITVKEKYFTCYITHQRLGVLLFISVEDDILRFFPEQTQTLILMVAL